MEEISPLHYDILLQLPDASPLPVNEAKDFTDKHRKKLNCCGAAPCEGQQEFLGRVTLTASISRRATLLTAATPCLRLHALKLKISSASVSFLGQGGVSVPLETEAISYDAKTESVVIPLSPKSVPALAKAVNQSSTGIINIIITLNYSGRVHFDPDSSHGNFALILSCSFHVLSMTRNLSTVALSSDLYHRRSLRFALGGC